MDSDEDPFADFFSPEPVKKEIDVNGAINNRLKRGVSPIKDDIPKKKLNLGSSYAKEYINQEKQKIFENYINAPSTSSNQDPEPNVLDDETEKVYNRYSFNLHPNKELPIYNYREEILDTIQSNPITIITASTGVGKTTQIPQYILENCRANKVRCNIIITQPRKIAAITIAQRVANERKCEIGTLVGYQVGLQKKLDVSDKETRILYCTTGVLLQKLIAKKNMNEYTHVIIDELHERDADIDFLMIVVRKLLISNSSNVKIILMSATIDVNVFAKYFESISNNAMLRAPVVKTEGERSHPIEICYLDDLPQLELTPDVIDFDTPKISKQLYIAAVEVIVICFKKAEMDVMQSNRKPAILIFLPGIYEIESLEKLLNDKEIQEEFNIKNCKICIMHSQLSPEDQKSAFVDCGQNKIILATNIAESSITIPDVKYVIDFCLTKYLTTASDTKVTSLELHWASKNSCDQRAGRCGRVSSGKVFRMVYRDMYNLKMSECSIPEILRCPLDTIVLKSKLLNMGSPKGILALAIKPPNESDILNSILSLKEIGGMTRCIKGRFEKEDGEITFLGNIMAALPLDVHLSRLIALGYVFSILDDAIIIAAGLNIKSIFNQEYEKKMQFYSNKLSWANDSGSDCIAILNAFKSWNRMYEAEKFKDPKIEKDWCHRYQLETKNLHDMRVLITDIRQRLEQFEIEEAVDVDWSESERKMVQLVCIAGAFFPNYYLRENIDENIVYNEIDGFDPFRTVYLTGNQSTLMTHLYEDQIKDKFVKGEVCSVKNNMKLHFHDVSSKIFITFSNENYQLDDGDENKKVGVVGKVLPEVYKSVKLRKLNKDFHIKIMENKIAERFACDSKLGKFSKSTGAFKPYSSKYKKPEFCVLPTRATKRLKGEISHIEHCNKFWFRPLNTDDNLGLWRYIKEKLAEIIFEECDDPRKITENKKVIVKTDDQVYRGRALRFIMDENMEDEALKYEILLIDYGKKQIFNNTEIMPVSHDDPFYKLFDYPPRVFEATLSEIEPSIQKSLYEKWTSEAIEYFRSEAEKTILTAEIFSVVDDVVSVKLFKDKALVNELLVREGHAQFCEENYMSKINHDKRREFQSENKSISPEVEFEDKIDESRKIIFKPPDQNICTNRLKLKGPFSPMESQLRAVAQFSTEANVSVDITSVNCVILDSEPQNNTQKRLYVGANVSEKIDRNPENYGKFKPNITVRETTCMPNIPGLTVLMAMTFCPVMELRRDERTLTRYTSVLTGLGCDSNQVSYFPERDSFFYVDVELKESDIELVNRLRYIMSFLLHTKGEEKVPDLTATKKNELLMSVKEVLLNILAEERLLIDTKTVKKSFKWSDPDEQKRDVVKHADPLDNKSIFSPHAIPKLYNMRLDQINELKENLVALRKADVYHTSIAGGIRCYLCNIHLEDCKSVRLHLLSKLHNDRASSLQLF